MKRPISSVCVCSPRAMVACHDLRHPIVCSSQELGWNATPYIIWSCILSKGHDGMLRLMSSNCMLFQRATRVCHVLTLFECV